MKRKKTSSELKAMAKEQLLGNYGIAAGTFAILYGIIFAVVILVYTAIMMSVVTNVAMGLAGMTSLVSSPWYMPISFLISAILGALMSTLLVGYSNIILKISRGSKPKVSDLFFCYSHHPDKVIVMYLIVYGVSFLLMLPTQIINYIMMDSGNTSGTIFLLWAVFYVVGLVLSVIFSMMVAQMYYLYIDYPQESSISFVKQSILIMKGNKGRLFYIMLSMIGWYLLIFVSCGIASFWVTPYMAVIIANFYRDLKGEFDEKPAVDVIIDDNTEIN